jgi:hypothetical protein
MVHLFLSQNFLVLVSKPAVSLQSASLLSLLLSPQPQYLAGLLSTIILALIQKHVPFSIPRPQVLALVTSLNEVKVVTVRIDLN